jgi:DNA polymerase III epsilon subunit-like protein
MALQGLISNTRYEFEKGSKQHGAASDAYAFADAMLAARKEDA